MSISHYNTRAEEEIPHLSVCPELDSNQHTNDLLLLYRDYVAGEEGFDPPDLLHGISRMNAPEHPQLGKLMIFKFRSEERIRAREVPGRGCDFRQLH